jgi:hypothetical protein
MTETVLTFVLLCALGVVITYFVLKCLIYVMVEDER